LDGSLSQFKLYDTALTAEEVKTLYQMGRCDEGHNVVNFSKTRVGIGLGDGEAPQAALDVRGSLRIPTTNDGITNGLIKINPINLELEFCTTLHDSSQAQPATGGTLLYPSGDTTVHKFTSSGSFTVTTGPLLVEYLILAGGGAGGHNHGGAGAGGGYNRGVMKVSTGTHSIIVGAGGAASTYQTVGSNGGDSSAFGIIAKGGGLGGMRTSNPTSRGYSGGSGGGGAGTAVIYGASGGTVTLGGASIIYADEWRGVRNDHSIQGHNGGIGTSGVDSTNAGNGGGGGGAGGPGGNANGTGSGVGSSGSGGIGLYDDFEPDTTFGTGMTGRGGGGSGGRWGSGTVGSPSLGTTSVWGGGGGGAQNSASQDATAGVDEKGGGGGGGSDGGGNAADGGDGIVMIRYFRPSNLSSVGGGP